MNVRSLSRLALVASVLFMAVVICGAQEARFARLTRSDGLSNLGVSSIAQDSRGFLWFGTKNGLNRYDGYSFLVYANDPFSTDSLSHNLVQTLFMDADDILWVGTYRGLNRFDTKTKRFIRYVHNPQNQESLSNDVVTAIRRDSAGRLWVGTLDGLNLFDEATGSFKRYRDAPDGSGALINDTVRSILEARDGSLWLGTYGGILRYNETTDSFMKFQPAEGRLPTDTVLVLSEDPEGHIWAGCWGGGLARIDRAKAAVRVWTFPDNRIYCLETGSPGAVFVGTWGGGLVELNLANDRLDVFRADAHNPYALSNDVVYSLFTDASGLLWIGTNGGGVHKLDRTRDRFGLFINDPQVEGSLARGSVMAVLEDSRGTLWVGTYNGGLNRLDPGAASFIHYTHDPKNPRSLSNDIVNGIVEDQEGVIWVATNEGLNRFDAERGVFARFMGGEGSDNGLPDQTVYAISMDSRGRHWYGYFRKGAERYDPRTGERVLFQYDPEDPGSLSDNLVYFIHEDAQGRVWIGTNGGLNRLDPGKRDFFRYKHDVADRGSLPSDTLRCMLQDSKGRLWFGTAPGGLSLLDLETGTFKHFSKKDGLSDDNVVSLLEDNVGRLWIGTTYGLNVFDPEKGDFKILDERDGLQGAEFNIGAFKNLRGELYFGGANGLNRISNADLRRNAHVPPVRLTSFRIFDTELTGVGEVADMREVRLSHRENFISIEFAALDFMDPVQNRYAYKLEGFDKDWVNAGARRYASYTNLPGGSYVFRVRASNNHDVWNDDGLSVRIEVSPPFWVTPAAVVLYLAIVVFILSTVVAWAAREQRFRLSVAELDERRRIEVELEKAKEAAEAADRAKSEFLANLSHEIRTPMNAVLGYSAILAEKMTEDPRRSLVEIIDRSARSLLALLNDALDLSRIDAGKAVKRETPLRLRALVQDLIEMFRLKAEEKGVQLSADTDDAVPPTVIGDESKLRQILVNLIGNAIKFTDVGSVTVRLSVEPGSRGLDLVIVVTDTGIGLSEEAIGRVFEPFYQQDPNPERYGGTGLGLTIVKRLTEELGGSIEVKSAPGEGSVFTVRIPGFRIQSEDSDVVPADDRWIEGLDLLVVEDDPASRDIITRMLESRGASIRTASDGKDALRNIEIKRPDAVLADLRMPNMDGFAFLKALRDHPPTHDLPVLIVTADLRAQTRARLSGFGAAVIIPKPIERSRLMDALEVALPGRVAVKPASGQALEGEAISAVFTKKPDASLTAEALVGELGKEGADAVIEALSGDALEKRRRISAALILDEWTAFIGAVEMVYLETGSRELGAYAARARAALSSFDAEELARVRAEFDALVRDAEPA